MAGVRPAVLRHPALGYAAGVLLPAVTVPALALLALPVFLISMMGVQFASPRFNTRKKSSAQGAVSKEPRQNFDRAHTAH